MLQLPPTSLAYGFLNDPIGTHGSRTLMLAELRLLLAACPHPASYQQLRVEALQHNALLKNTESNRYESFRRLRELYALDENLLLFRALRDLWDEDPSAQPLLALLCAVARDSILRATAALILTTPRDQPVTPHMMEAMTVEQFPDRYNDTTRATIGRNVVSSWQQSGHLRGRLKKVRDQANSRPTTVAYALLLGHLCDVRSNSLFHTLWARLLDAPEHTLREQAQQASRLGYLEYRHAGAITEISFQHLLRKNKS